MTGSGKRRVNTRMTGLDSKTKMEQNKEENEKREMGFQSFNT